MPWFLYILHCDGRLYTGITTDVARRLRQHKGELAGGAKFTHTAVDIRLVYTAEFPHRRPAARAEYRLKQRPRAHKLAIVATQPTPTELLAQLGLTLAD